MRVPHLGRPWFACACLLAVFLITSMAAAYGRVQWKSKRLKERETRGGSWKVELTIYLGSTPDMPTMPVKFEFKQNVYYERFLDDNHKTPQIRRVPTPGKKPIIEGADIGFLDPSTGKIQRRTKFSFNITRGHGFEAGEYTVTIRNARTGGALGTRARMILEGDNPVIDRRAMVFASSDDDDEKKKKEEEEKKKKEEESRASAGSMDNFEEDESDWPEDENENRAPPPIEEKPGACGCRAAGTSSPVPLELLLPAGLLIGAVARRRRRKAA